MYLSKSIAGFADELEKIAGLGMGGAAAGALVGGGLTGGYKGALVGGAIGGIAGKGAGVIKKKIVDDPEHQQTALAQQDAWSPAGYQPTWSKAYR